MKLMATFIHKTIKDPSDGLRMAQNVVIDTDALGISVAEAKTELKLQAHAMARKLGLGREGRDWDVILSEVLSTKGNPLDTASNDTLKSR